MSKYINKDAIVAEIKTRIETYNKGYANGDDCRADALETFLHDIDTLEVKNVDLEKEIDNYIDTKEVWEIQEAPLTSIENAAIHFFELGMAVSNKQIKEKI